MPSLATTRIIRAYAGVRPLVASDDDPSGRNVSRGIVLLDHLKRDGVDGFISITGGKLTSYRLMAEMTADLLCSKLFIKAKCHTADTPLPGSEKSVKFSTVVKKARELKMDSSIIEAAACRHGSQIEAMDFSGKGSELICECEKVCRAEISYAVKVLGVRSLDDLRRRTRLGMGPCQSSYCVEKAARALAEELGDPSLSEELKRDYLQHRWKGIVPICRGEQLAQAEYLRIKYGK